MEPRISSSLSMLMTIIGIVVEAVDETEGWGRGPYEELGNALEVVGEELRKLGF